MFNSDVVKGDDIPKSMHDVLHSQVEGKDRLHPLRAAGVREFAMDRPPGQGSHGGLHEEARPSTIGGLIRCGAVDKPHQRRVRHAGVQLRRPVRQPGHAKEGVPLGLRGGEGGGGLPHPLRLRAGAFAVSQRPPPSSWRTCTRKEGQKWSVGKSTAWTSTSIRSPTSARSLADAAKFPAAPRWSSTHRNGLGAQKDLSQDPQGTREDPAAEVGSLLPRPCTHRAGDAVRTSGPGHP